MEKCKEEPKLFYKYIKGKMTNPETIEKLQKGGRKYEKKNQRR